MISKLYSHFRIFARIAMSRAGSRCLALAVTGLLFANSMIAADSAAINLAAGNPAKGVKVVPEFSGKPVDGVLATFEITLPAHGKGCYFAADETGVPGYPLLPGNSNRVLPWIISGDGTGLFRPGYTQNPVVRPPTRMGMFALYQLDGGGVLALLPITGAGTTAWLEIAEDGRLLLRVGTFGTESYHGRLPALAWAKGDDVNQACHAVWSEALACPDVNGRTNWRDNKTYPEPFRYLGWCTYEEYKHDIDSDLLVRTVDGLENSGLPIRWLLVDEGFQKQVEKRLQSFGPDPEKFPKGWTPMIAKRNPDKIRWFGLWHAFQGLWKYLDTENDFSPELRAHLMRMPTGALLPRDDPESAAVFYDALIGSARDYGFDFVKIDVQTLNLGAYYGQANAARASAENSQALEKAVQRDQNGMINCMAQNPVCVFNTRYSAVTRCSVDYHKGNLGEVRSHILQSYANTLWMGQTVWPDHDEFHSSDAVGGRLMAVSKALSGGPVYLSDAPKSLVGEFIKPLCYEDGELLRPLAPAAPLPESAFADVLNEPVAYRVIAPLANGSAAVALYNLNVGKEETSIRGVIRAEDFRDASGMLQPYSGRWEVPAEGLVVYDWYAKKGRKLTGEWETTLKGFADALVLLTPIRQGWSVIGRADKYLAPSAITSCVESSDRLAVTLRESGPLLVYSPRRPTSEQGAITDQGGNIWRIELPKGHRDYYVVLQR